MLHVRAGAGRNISAVMALEFPSLAHQVSELPYCLNFLICRVRLRSGIFCTFTKENIMSDVTIEQLVLEVLDARAVEIRDVDGGEEPFLYSSGNWGPGYISIKGLVGRKEIMKRLTYKLAERLREETSRLNFIAGNVSGGVIPAWLLSEHLEEISGKSIPFVYIRDTRKKGGQKELITGIENNPEIPPGSYGLVVEELVNFAETTCNGAMALRDAGYRVTHAACILFYDNPESIKALESTNVELIYLFTLRRLLEIAENRQTHSLQAITGFREFLRSPLEWQAKRGLIPVREGGTK